jgi:hypothetical protein
LTSAPATRAGTTTAADVTAVINTAWHQATDRHHAAADPRARRAPEAHARPGRHGSGAVRAADAHGRTNPGVSRPISQATFGLCQMASDGDACTSAVLTAIDAARAAEGVGPMHLPADYRTLTVTEQLLVVTDQERVDRGLIPAAGLSASLNRRAWAGARADTDPALEPMYGDSAGSNWAGGYSSVLEADFAWMYDDGPGSPNLDCGSAGGSGCWGHRDNILATYHAPLAMGVAVDADTSEGVSMTQLFMGGDSQTGPGQADAIVARAAAAGRRR